mmetsp:Transcript_16418/g.33388  ORF Transcript_16418/g.33388 Transcript_16418/m.33388 type:complete len:205 (+) Transcript_16418:1710-2324(+)
MHVLSLSLSLSLFSCAFMHTRQSFFPLLFCSAQMGQLRDDIDGRPQGSADLHDFMDFVSFELFDQILVYRRVSLDLGDGQLLQKVVESRCPLPASQTGCGRAIVNHVFDTLEGHVGVQRVDGLDDGLVGNLRIGMAGVCEEIALSDHHGCVESRSCRVDLHCGFSCPGVSHLGCHPPELCVLNLSHGVQSESSAVVNHGSDLTT